VLLRRAERGELDGFIYLASCVEGEDKIGLCGRYLNDLDEAISSAAAGFNCLLGHKACIEQNASKLPRRLRKESANDQICHAVSCSMRK
jgi:hypothetical protein